MYMKETEIRFSAQKISSVDHGGGCELIYIYIHISNLEKLPSGRCSKGGVTGEEIQDKRQCFRDAAIL